MDNSHEFDKSKHCYSICRNFRGKQAQPKIKEAMSVTRDELIALIGGLFTLSLIGYFSWFSASRVDADDKKPYPSDSLKRYINLKRFEDSLRTINAFHEFSFAYEKGKYNEAQSLGAKIDTIFLDREMQARLAQLMSDISRKIKRETNVEGVNFNKIKNDLLLKKYIYPLSIEIIEKYGDPKTLTGTNNQTWFAYFPKGNFTLVIDKRTDQIILVLLGRAQ